jgi:GrpB-like predicted nucleotidyltransferase (UPF0157 family)
VNAEACDRSDAVRSRLGASIRATRTAIIRACGEHVLDVLHVGSTAIPGIAAKPVIDMMPLLRRHEDRFACVRVMAGARVRISW